MTALIGWTAYWDRMESDLKAPLLLPTSRRRTRTPPVTAATAMQRPAGQPRGPLHHHSPLPPTDPDEEEPSDEDNGNGGVPDPSPRHLMSSTPSHGSPANEGSSDLPDPLPTDRGVNATSGPVALALARPPPVPWHANLNQLSAMISNFSTSYVSGLCEKRMNRGTTSLSTILCCDHCRLMHVWLLWWFFVFLCRTPSTFRLCCPSSRWYGPHLPPLKLPKAW